MIQEEYKAKKRECWEEFKRTNLDGEVQWQPVNRYDVFCAAFDRAYALGREKETITQEEIEKAAEEYSKHLGKSRNVTWNDAEYGFIAGANFALGKHEKDAETVIQGWVCRDKKDNALILHVKEPYRTYSNYSIVDKPDLWESDCASFLPLDNSLFPDLTWDDEPIEVEIIIKRKKNG